MNPEGIGLGLFICKKIVSQIGPEQQNIKIQSEVGQGSSFIFNIFKDIIKEKEKNNPNSKRKDTKSVIQMSSQKKLTVYQDMTEICRVGCRGREFQSNNFSQIVNQKLGTVYDVHSCSDIEVNSQNFMMISEKKRKAIKSQSLMPSQSRLEKKINRSLEVIFLESKSAIHQKSESQIISISDNSEVFKSAQELFKLQQSIMKSDDYIIRSSFVEQLPCMSKMQIDDLNVKNKRQANIACADDDVFQRFGLKAQICQTVKNVEFNLNYNFIEEFNSGEQVIEYFR